jgi:hypothetical protein
MNTMEQALKRSLLERLLQTFHCLLISEIFISKPLPPVKQHLVYTKYCVRDIFKMPNYWFIQLTSYGSAVRVTETLVNAGAILSHRAAQMKDERENCLVKMQRRQL